jgi:hypothetical protein
MKGFLFVLGSGLLMTVYAVFFLRWARKKYRADPEAVKHVRLTTDGSGWLYEYGWPKRKKRNKHH